MIVDAHEHEHYHRLHLRLPPRPRITPLAGKRTPCPVLARTHTVHDHDTALYAYVKNTSNIYTNAIEIAMRECSVGNGFDKLASQRESGDMGKEPRPSY